jgi:hypothetical protein
MKLKDEPPLPDPLGLVVTEPPSRKRYSSEQDLIWEEGWTKAAIERFLPAMPDLIGPWRLGEPGDPPMKHWLRRRVSRIRLTNKQYQTWRLRSDKARANEADRDSGQPPLWT